MCRKMPDRFTDDVQDGDRGLFLQAGVKKMRRNAGYGDQIDPGVFEAPEALQHFRQGVGTIFQDGRRPVRNFRIAVDDDARMILIASDLGGSDDLAEKIDGGCWPHAAENADGFWIFHVYFPAFPLLSPRVSNRPVSNRTDAMMKVYCAACAAK